MGDYEMLGNEDNMISALKDVKRRTSVVAKRDVDALEVAELSRQFGEIPGVALAADTEVDFGSTPVFEATFTITDENVSTTSIILAQVKWVSPSDGRDINEIMVESFDIKCAPGSGSFDMKMESRDGSVAGLFVVSYIVVNP